MPCQGKLRFSLLAICLLAGLQAAIAQNVPAGLREVLTLEDGTRIQIEEFPGFSKWALFKHMFTAATVHVHCPEHKDFDVFTARTVEDVREAYSHKDRAWCGWDHFTGRSPETCVVSVPPFGPSCVAVAKPKGWFGMNAGDATACYMQRVEEFSMPRLLSTIMGAFLFSAAPELAMSTPFRLAGGSLAFAALSGVIVLFILIRNMPQRRSLVVGTLMFGSTFVAVMHYIFGTWLPSLAQLARNPLVIGATTLSGLVGMGVTYYYNDTTNVKINTMLRVALQLVGLALMAGSASSLESGALVVGLAVLGRLMPLIQQERSVLQALRRAKTAVQHDLKESIPSREEVPLEGPVSPLTPAPPTAQVEPPQVLATVAAAAVTAATAAGTPLPPSPLVARGLILNVETGKTIQIEKGTYIKLTQQGYEVDLVAGTITPPRDTGKSAEQSSRRGFGSTGGSSGSGVARRRSRSRVR